MKISKKTVLLIFFFILSNVASYVAGVAISRKNTISKTTDLFYRNQVASEVFYYQRFSDVAREISSKNYEKARCMVGESARHIFYVLRQCAGDENCRDYSGMSYRAPDLLREKPPEIMDAKNCP